MRDDSFEMKMEVCRLRGEGLSTEEIAERTGLNEMQVKLITLQLMLLIAKMRGEQSEE